MAAANELNDPPAIRTSQVTVDVVLIGEDEAKRAKHEQSSRKNLDALGRSTI